MLRAGCSICATRDSAFEAARGFHGSQDFRSDFFGLFGIEIHRDFDALCFDIKANHALVGRADLQVRRDITFGIDAHCRLRCAGDTARLQGVENQARLQACWGMNDVILRRFEPPDAPWLVERHATLYARDEGFDDTFGPLVASILQAFIAGHDPSRECGWIAECDGQKLGSIFCVGLTKDVAKLRLFLLTPEARGKGMGKHLLATCMAFARDVGYREMQLWTHESHKAACALYRKFGWQIVSAKPVHSFGVDLVEQSWRVDL